MGDTTKFVVAMQWDTITAHMERSLQAAGITPIVLRGHLSQRQKAIARFVDTSATDASVLLLSLEQGPTGMNLACAHHLIFVHPVYTERPDDAAGYEAQASGRLRRQGQNHTVCVHRFVARDTIEETLARRHHAESLRRHSAAGRAAQAWAGEKPSAMSVVRASSDCAA